MSMATFHTRIFDPLYTYKCAARYLGEQSALEYLLNYIGYEHLIRGVGLNKVYPIKTPYHNYRRNIAVITEGANTFCCKTFTDGVPGDSFEMVEEIGKVKAFFEKAGSELTVIDLFSARELIPEFNKVQSYLQKVSAARCALEEHVGRIADYKQKLSDFRKDGVPLLNGDPRTSYQQAVNLFESYLQTLDAMFGDVFHQMREETRGFDMEFTEKEARVKMFGLYVYVLSYGISKRRFLRKNSTLQSRNFSQAISDMRKLVASDDGVVDRYIGEMELSRNERENLLFMLDEEGIIGPVNKFVGDELFV